MPRNQPQESYTCTAPDDEHPERVCGKPSRGRSLCATHLRRLQRNGTLERHRKPAKSRTQQHSKETCKHKDGCPLPVWAKGWCAMHYSRAYNNDGNPGPVGRVRQDLPPSTCKHPDDCARPRTRRDGWCHMHGNRVDKTGEPGPVGVLLRRPSVHTALEPAT